MAPITANEFIDEIKQFNPNPVESLIRKAFFFAEEVHKGQKRVSGEEYFTHPLEVARILMKLGADSATITAALLHDSVEQTGTTTQEIEKMFGEEVSNLVEGVTKTSEIFESKEIYTAENLRKILLATTKDIRVMLIKLADRLHNMRTLGVFRPDKQKRIAQETLDIYAPIAEKLGMWSIKGELEDLSLKYLEPDVYQQIKKRIAEKRKLREEKTAEFIKVIKDKLKEHNIDSSVTGRAKYFYSIYKKMKEDEKTFDQIYDLIGVRIIVHTIPECYRALGVIHELWEPIPGRFKDYIQSPKPNGYQSLHTDVMCLHKKVIEVQIRTVEMHQRAEEGVAAHWLYKGTERDKEFDRKIAWLKQLLEWKRNSKNAKEFIEVLKIDLFEKEIVVFTPKGDPISLPETATAVDFAYAVHSNIGDHCSKAEVNGKIVPLDHVLKSGDVIYILTLNNAKPSRNWLTFVITSKAKNRIRTALGIETESDPKGGREKKTLEVNPMDYLEIDAKKSLVKFSKCCSPEVYSPIIAFETKDGKITIHKKDCPNISSLENSKQVPVSWREEESKDIRRLRVMIEDRVGIFAEILNLVSQTKVKVRSINTKTIKDRISLRFEMEIAEEDKFNELVKRIKSVNKVVDVKKED